MFAHGCCAQTVLDGFGGCYRNHYYRNYNFGYICPLFTFVFQGETRCLRLLSTYNAHFGCLLCAASLWSEPSGCGRALLAVLEENVSCVRWACVDRKSSILYDSDRFASPWIVWQDRSYTLSLIGQCSNASTAIDSRIGSVRQFSM
jgi:hypothetical protein